MPEYIAPGVFIEETPFRMQSIEGVATTTAAFVGPCRFGPVGGKPRRLTSYTEFEAIYGDSLDLSFENLNPVPNYLAHAVRCFFDEGGSRLYVARIFRPVDNVDGVACWNATQTGTVTGVDTTLELRARYPGAAGNLLVTLLTDARRHGSTKQDCIHFFTGIL